ncbi:DUF2461 domain-containing protein [Streptacidiphilus monticola]
MFRPNRDVRFSADKSPYKTAIGATLEHGGYIQLSAEGLALAAGYYGMAADQLARYRAAVAEDLSGAELERIIAELTEQKIEVRSREQLKSAPRGFPKDHPRIELLRHKDLFAWRQHPAAAWLGTAAAKRRAVDFLRATRPSPPGSTTASARANSPTTAVGDAAGPVQRPSVQW